MLEVGQKVYRVDPRAGLGAPRVEVAVVERITAQSIWLKGADGHGTGLAFGCNRRFDKATKFSVTPAEAWLHYLDTLRAGVQMHLREAARLEDMQKVARKKLEEEERP